MEAIKSNGKPLTFTWGDLTVLVKPRASSGDKMEVAFTPPGSRGTSERFRLAARLMVLDIKGLTNDGQLVPYSPEELDNVPDIRREDGKLDLFATELGLFIWKNTDISCREETDLKNASALPSNGPAGQAPSTASAKTA